MSSPNANQPGQERLSAFASDVSSLPEYPFDWNVVLTNLFLALLVVLLFGVTSAIFNSTIDDNRTEISTKWRAFVAQFGWLTAGFFAIERGLQGATGRARL